MNALVTGRTANVNTQGGNDAIVLGGGSLDGIVGTLNLNAGAGTDGLTLNDSADLDANSYVFGPTAISRAALSVALLGVETVNIQAGLSTGDAVTGADTVNSWAITGSNSGTLNGGTFSGVENLNGGSLADSFVFGAAGDLTSLNGGAGVNGLSYAGSSAAIAVVMSAAQAGTVTSGVNSFTFSNIRNVDADGTQSNSLTAQNGGVNLIINGGNAGNTGGSGIAFTALQSITGGTGDDTFIFTNSGSISGALAGGGGTGVDTLTGDNDGNAFVITGVNTGTLAGKTTGWSGIQNLSGGTGMDTFVFQGGGSLGGTIVGGADSDTLTGDDSARTYAITGANQGTLAVLMGGNWSGIENLVGGTANDSFVLSNGATLSGSIDGGSGGNTISYAAYTTAVTVNLNSGAATGVTGGIGGIQIVLGGSAADNLTASTSFDSTISGNGGADILNLPGLGAGATANLIGGAGDDIFSLGAGGSLGSILGTANLNGGADTDTLTLDDTASVLATSWTINTTSVLRNAISYGLTGFEALSVLAGGGVDTFTINNTGVSTILNSGAGADVFNLIGLTASLELRGGLNNDTYNIPFGLGDVTLVETGPGGSDILNATGTVAAEAFVWTGSSLSNGSNTINGAANIESIVLDGNGALDSLSGPAANQTWTLSGAMAGSVGNLSFVQISNLVGGALDDVFSFNVGVVWGGNLSGGTGSNSLDFGAYSTALNVNLQTGTASGLLGVFSGMGNVTGGMASDTLTGTDNNTTWTISALNGGTVGSVEFSGFENVVGGGLADSFVFTNAGSLSGSIDGGAGVNSLTGDADGNVFVVNGVNGGTLAGKTSGWSNIQNLNGGAGVDGFSFSNAGSLTGAVDGAGGVNGLTGDDDGNVFVISGMN
ncbi:MAG: hypothetical protein HC904_14120, partial [Blastochloris sp.]|nr:hypothetical protein [Blastochloris sp.]